MRMVKNAWARAEGQRPAMPGDNSRPEPSSRALNTLKPCRVPLVVTAGGWPRRAQVSRNEPHGAKLTASAHRSSPCRRLAARQRSGEMRRHNAGLWERKAPMVPQRPPILPVGEPAARAPEPPPAEDRLPTSRLTAHDARPCVQPRHQAVRRAGGPRRAATAAVTVAHAVHAAPPPGLLPGIEPRWTAAPARAPHRYGPGVDQPVAQDGGAPHHPSSIAPIGVLQTAVQLFDGGATALSPEAHGCLRLEGGLAWGQRERHPCAHGSQS